MFLLVARLPRARERSSVCRSLAAEYLEAEAAVRPPALTRGCTQVNDVTTSASAAGTRLKVSPSKMSEVHLKKWPAI